MIYLPQTRVRAETRAVASSSATDDGAAAHANTDVKLDNPPAPTRVEAVAAAADAIVDGAARLLAFFSANV